MRNGYIIDRLTSFDICETVKMDGKLIEIYEGVIYRDNFKITPFRKVIEILFALRKIYKDEKKRFNSRVSYINFEQLIGSSNTQKC